VDGTNIKAESADYPRNVFAAMEDMIGPVHEASYILAHEVPACRHMAMAAERRNSASSPGAWRRRYSCQ
jgi:hypothetical protein